MKDNAQSTVRVLGRVNAPFAQQLKVIESVDLI